jgi:hypothetical protein
MSTAQPKTYAGVSDLIDGIQAEVERRVSPSPVISLSLLRDARSHLSLAVIQAHPSDDQIIADHVRQALLLTDMAIKLSEAKS